METLEEMETKALAAVLSTKKLKPPCVRFHFALLAETREELRRIGAKRTINTGEAHSMQRVVTDMLNEGIEKFNKEHNEQ